MRGHAAIQTVLLALSASVVVAWSMRALAGGIEPTLSPSRLGIENDFATFNFGGRKGSFDSTAVRVDYSTQNRASVRLRLPIVYIHFSDGEQHTGVGDLELRSKIKVYDAHEWLSFIGLSETFPTGKYSWGMSAGAPTFSAYVTAGYKIKYTILYATVGDNVTMPRSGPVHINYVNPDRDHEIDYSAGVMHGLSEKLYVAGAVTGITVLERGDAGKSLATVGAVVAYRPVPAFRFALGGQLPIAGERRFDAKGSVMTYWFF
jgi:hypothetical protein